MTGPPERGNFRNVQVRLLCVVDNTEHEGIFPAQRILRKATRADISKLVKKFNSADGTEVDESRVRPYLRPYLQGAFEMQQCEYETSVANFYKTPFLSTPPSIQYLCHVHSTAPIWKRH